MNISFYDFVVISSLKNKYPNSPKGDLIEDILEDLKFPVDATTKTEVSSHLHGHDDALEAFSSLWRGYRSSYYTPNDLPKDIPQKLKDVLEIKDLNPMSLEQFFCYGKVSLPYGKYIMENDNEYLFNRGYEPILYKNFQTGRVQICKKKLFKGIKKETIYFYDSYCAPYKSTYTHYKIARILKLWDQKRILARRKQVSPSNYVQTQGPQQLNERPI